MIQDEIDPRPWGERGQLLEQLQGLEDEMPSAVGPGRFEGEEHAVIAQEPEAVLGDGRAQQIAAELLQARAVSSGDSDIGVQVETLEMRMPRDGAGYGVSRPALPSQS
jgi:hypothetical protein